jgi:hypothetical protein
VQRSTRWHNRSDRRGHEPITTVALRSRC